MMLMFDPIESDDYHVESDLWIIYLDSKHYVRVMQRFDRMYFSISRLLNDFSEYLYEEREFYSKKKKDESKPMK